MRLGFYGSEVCDLSDFGTLETKKPEEKEECRTETSGEPHEWAPSRLSPARKWPHLSPN